jgi:hypothetical protein
VYQLEKTVEEFETRDGNGQNEVKGSDAAWSCQERTYDGNLPRCLRLRCAKSQKGRCDGHKVERPHDAGRMATLKTRKKSQPSDVKTDELLVTKKAGPGLNLSF